MSERLQKLLAHAGLGSRRELETWIEAGRISINGKRAKLGDRAEVTDRILVDGKQVRLSASDKQAIKAILYHKPEGEICTRKDPKGRPTIFGKLPSLPAGRWVSVGRLDINTSGLILLTNSGQLANKLMHPSTGLEREYLVRVRGLMSAQTIEKLTQIGVDLDGRPARFERVVAADMAEEGTNHWYRVILKEGRYREVRRLCEAVNHPVSRLKRIRYGTVRLPRSVKRGQHVKLAPKQLERLVSSVGLQKEFAEQLYSSKNPTRQTKGYSKTHSKTHPKSRPKPHSRSRREEPPKGKARTSTAKKGSATSDQRKTRRRS